VVVLTDEGFLSLLAVLDDLALPESEPFDPAFAESDPDELSADEEPEPLAEPSLDEPSLAADTLLEPFRLSVR